MEFNNFLIGPEALKLFKRAYRFQMRGQFREAVSNYKASLALQKTAEAYTFMGWAYSQMDELEKAVRACKLALRIDPEFGNAYNDMGAYLLQQGDIEHAALMFLKAKHAARYAHPEFPCMNLGRLYEIKGLWPLAIDEYKEALAINPEYENAREALERLQARLN